VVHAGMRPQRSQTRIWRAAKKRKRYKNLNPIFASYEPVNFSV
jgi:hypothetical protein